MWRLAFVLASIAHAVPSVPPPVSANALALQRTLTAAAASSSAAGNPFSPGRPLAVTVPPGRYTFSDTSLAIAGAANLDVNAHNATFVFYFGHGLVVSDSANVSVRGPTLDADPPNYAQGTVTAVAPDGSGFVASFDPRFIPPDCSVQPFSQPGGLAGAKVMFWDARTRLPLPATQNFMNGSSSAPHGSGGSSDGAWRIDVHNAFGPADAPNRARPPVGALVTVFARRGNTFALTNSSGCLAEDVTVHAGGNMGFLEHLGGGGHTYRRVAIVRRPAGGDGDVGGLMANNADGFHSDSVGRGPALLDSEIAFTGDDHLNVMSRMLVVCEAGNASDALVIVDVSRGGLAAARPGDGLGFYQLIGGPHPGVNPLMGRGVIAAGAAPELVADDAALVRQCDGAAAAMAAPPYSAHLVVSLQGSPVYRVRFAAPLPPAVAATRFNLVTLERQSGGGALIRNSSFHDSCGTGGRIILKARNATYEGNVAARFGGLHIYTEQEWLEGDLGLGGVALRNNTFVDQRGGAVHVDVMAGLPGVTCSGTTFVECGNVTMRASGC
jgi:hypothetical protein